MAESGRQPSLITVEVAYALPDRQELIEVELPAGATVLDAIERSGIPARYPGIELRSGWVGVYGKTVRLDTRLRAGDRVEIYRPLIADPKSVRQARAGSRKRRGPPE